MLIPMYTSTVIGRILREHLVEGDLAPGAEIGLRIDQTLCQDATGTMAFLELEAMGVERVKTELSVQYIDHNTSQFGPENHNDHLYLESITAAKGVLFSRPGNGICHQVHLERFGVPGKTLLGSDSHTPTNGGIGMVAIGAGGLDVAVAMAGGPFKMTAPRIIGVKLVGSLSPWVAAKDIILHLLSVLSTKGNVGWAVEYFGPGVETLTVPERATVTNMGAELGVTTSVFPSDEVTRRFLKAQGREEQWRPLQADAITGYDRVIEIDISRLVPMAACPSSPDNVKPVSELSDVPVSQVVVGSCTNGSLKDMRMLAAVLDGKTVPPAVCLAVAPGSRQVLRMLADTGDLGRIIGAGARVLESACGPCIGQGMSPASGTATARSFNRNFAGRSGTKGDQTYLVSVETAVATALNGCLTDPRSLDIAYPHLKEPELFRIDDTMIVAPPPPDEAPEIVRKETIGAPPHCDPFPVNLEGEVLVNLGDKVTTDHIMPAGTFLKLRSNIPLYSRVVFNYLNEQGKPTFAEVAETVRDKGKFGAIVAGNSYGQGSSREHAAICPMFLGVRLVMARSVERIHAANLVNFGILPLVLKCDEDKDRLSPGDRFEIRNVPAQLAEGAEVEIVFTQSNGGSFTLSCRHELSAQDIALVLAGGRLNLEKARLANVS